MPTSPIRSSGTPTTATSATPSMPQQRLLDLGRVDVEAAGDVHVLEPVGDRAGCRARRACRCRRCAASRPRRSPRGSPRGRRGSRASRSRRAPAARRSSAAIRVSMPGIARPLVVATVSAESPSRHIVTTTASVIPNAVTTWSMRQLVAHPLDQHHGYDGRAGDREPQRGQVALGAAGRVEQRLVERRRAREDRDPLRLDQPHRLVDVEGRDRVERAAGEQADHDADLVAEGVEERVDHQVAVVLRARRRARPRRARRRWSAGARSSRPSTGRWCRR